jgi:hypothetical protein
MPKKDDGIVAALVLATMTVIDVDALTEGSATLVAVTVKVVF